jgi:hypothetical protein
MCSFFGGDVATDRNSRRNFFYALRAGSEVTDRGVAYQAKRTFWNPHDSVLRGHLQTFGESMGMFALRPPEADLTEHCGTDPGGPRVTAAAPKIGLTLRA